MTTRISGGTADGTTVTPGGSAVVDAKVGTNTDAATDPSDAGGTVFSKLRGLGDDVDNAASQTLVPAADSTNNGYVSEAVGSKEDTALASPLTAAVTLTASVIRYLKTLMARTIAPSAADNATAAASASLYETLGRKDDVATSVTDSTTNVHPLAKYIKGLMGRTQTAPTVDNTTAAASSGLGSTLGRKDDTAATSITTTATLFRYAKAILANLGFWTKDNYATVACATGAETDVVAQQTIAKPSHVVAKLDLTNLTANATIKVYHAMGAAGATLRAGSTQAFVVASDPKIVEVDFWTDGDYKITVTTGAEGASRDVYVRHSKLVSV